MAEFVEKSFTDENGVEQTIRLRKPTRDEAMQIADKSAYIILGSPEDGDLDFTSDFLKLCVHPDVAIARELVELYPSLAFSLPREINAFKEYTVSVKAKAPRDITFLITSTDTEDPYEYEIKCYRLKNAAFLSILNADKTRATVLDKQARLHLHPDTMNIAAEALKKLPFLGFDLGTELINITRPKFIDAKKK